MKNNLHNSRRPRGSKMDVMARLLGGEDHRTVPDTIFSQNSVTIVCALVHQPEWQFWVEFINSCCGRRSYSENTPFRRVLIKAAAQKMLCFGSIRVFHRENSERLTDELEQTLFDHLFKLNLLGKCSVFLNVNGFLNPFVSLVQQNLTSELFRWH